MHLFFVAGEDEMGMLFTCVSSALKDCSHNEAVGIVDEDISGNAEEDVLADSSWVESKQRLLLHIHALTLQCRVTVDMTRLQL